MAFLIKGRVFLHFSSLRPTRNALSKIQQCDMLTDFLMYSKNTFRQGVSNDGGSHVETSSICVVPLGII